MPLEDWRDCWRRGVAPLLSDAALHALAKALQEDSPRLIQGETTEPPADPAHEGEPCEGACLIAFPLWQTLGLNTAGEVAEAFGRFCVDVDDALGDGYPAAVMSLFAFWDDRPREEAVRAVHGEVVLELDRRRRTQTDTLTGEAPF